MIAKVSDQWMLGSYYQTFWQQKLIHPIAKRLSTVAHCSPSFITGASLVMGILGSISLWLHQWLYALAGLWLSGGLDALDGSLARAQARTSANGAVLDIVSDRIVEFSVILGLYLWQPSSSRALACLWMAGSSWLCVTTFLVVAIFTSNQSHKSFHYSPGLIERMEAFCLFSLMIVWPDYMVPLAWLYTILVLWT